MKKIFLFVAFAIMTIATLFISSCAKTETQDLTTDIVGTFLGTATDTTAGTVGQNPHSGVTITVTKVDATHVTISEATGGYFTNMSATITTSNSGGTVFSISTFTDGGNTWSQVADAAYSPSAKRLVFLIHETAGTSVGDLMAYDGTKQ